MREWERKKCLFPRTHPCLLQRLTSLWLLSHWRFTWIPTGQLCHDILNHASVSVGTLRKLGVHSRLKSTGEITAAASRCGPEPKMCLNEENCGGEDSINQNTKSLSCFLLLLQHKIYLQNCFKNLQPSCINPIAVPQKHLSLPWLWDRMINVFN